MKENSILTHTFNKENLGAKVSEIVAIHNSLFDNLDHARKERLIATEAIVQNIAEEFCINRNIPFRMYNFWLTDSVVDENGNAKNGRRYIDSDGLDYIILQSHSINGRSPEKGKIDLSSIAIMVHEYIGHILASHTEVKDSNNTTLFKQGLHFQRIKAKSLISDKDNTLKIYNSIINNEEADESQMGMIVKIFNECNGDEEVFMKKLKEGERFYETVDGMNVGTNLDEGITDLISDTEISRYSGFTYDSIRFDVDLEAFGYDNEKNKLKKIVSLISTYQNLPYQQFFDSFYEHLIESKRTGSIKPIVDFIFKSTQTNGRKGFKINPKDLLNLDISNLKEYLTNQNN